MTRKLRGRATAKEVNQFSRDRREISLSTTAANAPLPIVYGEASVPGLIAAYGADGTDLVVQVIWCAGPVKSIKVFINDVEHTSGTNIKARHYRGLSVQDADDWVAAIDTISGYTDAVTLLKPDGVLGVAYSVFVFDSTAITNAPRFQAIVKGCCDIPDPDNTNDGDPFYDDVGFSLVFEGTNGTSPTGLDTSPNSHTITYAGDADIQSNQLDLDGTGDWVTLTDDSSVEFGSAEWTLELKVTPQTVTGTDYFIGKGNAVSSRAFRVGRNGTSLTWSLSSDGTTWDIEDATFASGTFASSTEATIVVEFTGREYILWADGAQVRRVVSTDTINNTVNAWYIGAFNGASGWEGQIRSARFTKGWLRYGGVHVSTGLPFADSATYSDGNVYTDNPALCAGHLIASNMYGFGADVLNLSAAKDWCDEEIATSIARARLGLLINTTQPTASLLDLICTYGDLRWTHEGSDIKLLPDRPCDVNNPSGQEQLDNAVMNADTDWTKGSDWTYNASEYFIHASTSSQSTLSQTAPALEDGVEYVLSITFWHLSGTHRVRLNGTEVIPDWTTTSLSSHKLRFTADSTYTAPLLEIEADTNSQIIIFSCSLRRLYWLEQYVIAGSMNIEGVSDSSTPSKVVVRYRESDTDTANWPEKISSSELPGVSSGEIPLIETTVNMPGIFRAEEAANKAASKLNRLQNRVRYSWISLDAAMLFQPATVVQLQISARSLDVLVMVDEVEMLEPGRYRVSGMSYSDDHWPDDYTDEPTESGTVPVGAIVFLNSGASAPSGWAVYSTLDGYYIKGAGLGGSDPAVADTGGSNTYSGWTSNTAYDGGHNGQSGSGFEVESFESRTSTGSGAYFTVDDTLQDNHRHSISTGTVTPNLYHRKQRLIQKTGSTDTVFPENAILLSHAFMTVTNLVRSAAWKYRLLMANSTDSNGGVGSKSLSVTTGSGGSTHDHWTFTNVSDGYPTALGFTPPHYDVVSNQGGAHTHSANLTLNRNPQRYRLGLWHCEGDVEVKQNQIIMWAGSMTTMPEDSWTLCDGTLGTPDLASHFIEVANWGAQGTSTGDNTISLSGETAAGGGHDHIDEGSYDTANSEATRTLYHSNDHTHTHTVSESASWQPPWYALAFLMYNPSPTLAFIDVALLISGGEADGTTTIVDDSNDGLSATVTGGTGTLEYDDAQTKFSLNSIKCNGHKVAYSGLTDYGPKFTIEGWFRADDLSAEYILFSNTEGGTDDYTVVLETDGDVALEVNGTKQATVAAGISADEWFYVAVCYDAAEWRLYAGRDSVGTASQASYTDAAADTPDGFYIVSDSTGTGGLNGWFLQTRITRGAARYSAAVIGVPAAAFATS